ncbi:phage tail protein [Parvularcula marina]|uniref:phage tail protein n=1 Tax=Parvularcula marina TaxID=2292771 RepID=UPI0018F548AB|nr:tail fiber protein [Parvularcula marina]
MKKLKRSVGVALGLLAGGAAMAGTSASAQECYLGEIGMFAGNFTPRNWLPADGRMMDISQNTALFSLLGTIYGGDGRTTFALPDLRGRSPVGYGQGPGLSDRRVGSKAGAEVVTPPSASIETAPGNDPVVVGGAPIMTAPPTLAIGYQICVAGYYPSRN